MLSKFSLLLLVFYLSVVLLITESHAQTEQSFEQMDIETLMEMDVVVTSAAKRKQNLSNVSAAMFVINQEDIETSGGNQCSRLIKDGSRPACCQNRYSNLGNFSPWFQRPLVK